MLAAPGAGMPSHCGSTSSHRSPGSEALDLRQGVGGTRLSLSGPMQAIAPLEAIPLGASFRERHVSRMIDTSS
jgi:hypothetical protein